MRGLLLVVSPCEGCRLLFLREAVDGEDRGEDGEGRDGDKEDHIAQVNHSA